MFQKKKYPMDRDHGKSASERAHLERAAHIFPRAGILERFRAWLPRRWKMITRVAAALATLATGTWAVITFIYPTTILPILEPGYLQVSIKPEQIGASAGYSVHQITLELKNTGHSRLYVPSTYFLARAFNVIPLVESHKSAAFATGQKATNSPTGTEATPSTNMSPSTGEKPSKKLDDAMRSILTKMTPRERKALIAQAQNYLFVSQWEKGVATNSFFGEINQRGVYDIDEESFVYLQFNRLTGISELLDPGETSFTQVLVFVPEGYQVLSMECKGIASKERIPNIVMVGAFHKGGIAIIPFETTPDLEKRLSVFRQSVGENVTNGTIDRLEKQLPKSSFYFGQRIESYVQVRKELSTLTATNAAIEKFTK